MVRAAFKKQFSKALTQNGLSPAYYFEKVGLPTHTQEDPNSLLPAKPFWNLVNLVAIQARIPDFGMQVAELTPWHKVDSLRPLIGDSDSLEDLLQNFCRVMPYQRSRATFAIEPNETDLSFIYSGLNLAGKNIQMELYRITGMIHLVQLATGPHWFPEQIDLQMPENDSMRSIRILDKSRILFSQQSTRFTIPNELLSLQVALEDTELRCDINQVDIDIDFIDTVRQLISIFISNRNCTVDDIANAIEVPKRNLQRILKTHGTNFSELLAQEKFIRAKNKLASSSMKISTISRQMGYSDPAHFANAFHRWSGMSPSEFRSKMQ